MKIIDIINKTNDSIETLNLQNLLVRPGWNELSVENIFELANKGVFGLYYNPSKITGSSEKKTYKPLNEYIKSLIDSKSIKESDRDYYLRLKGELITFAKNNKFLLKHKFGYVRLATFIEVAIFPPCESGSISRFKKESGITNYQDDNNYFGFVFLGRANNVPKTSIISPAYHLYTKVITQKDLIVFIDQIELLERKLEESLANNTLDGISVNLKKKLESNFSNFLTAAFQANKESKQNAEKKWEECLYDLLGIAKKNPKLYSASKLADLALQERKFRQLGKIGTLRKKIREDSRFDNFLK